MTPLPTPSHMDFNLVSCISCVFFETELACLKLYHLEWHCNILRAFVLRADEESQGNSLAMEEPIPLCHNWQSGVKSFPHRC